MATINLGNIKFKWQGAYNGATAYTVDDVVSYNGSSYICTANSTGNLPTNTSYWDQMSSAGTDADLLSISGTAQGDIYYNSGGAIAKLAAGTNGQLLQTGGAGANPSWTTLSTDYIKILTATADGTSASLVLDNIFDDSTYQCYKIFWTGNAAANIQSYINFLDSSGTIITASNYRSGYRTHYVNSSTNAVNNYANWNTAYIQLHADIVSPIAYQTPQIGEMILYHPESTSIQTTIMWKCTSDDGGGTSVWNNSGVGRYGSPVTHRGIAFTNSASSNFGTNFKVVVYGVKK